MSNRSKDKLLEYKRKWYSDNKVKIAAQRVKNKTNNPEKDKNYQKVYRVKHKAQIKAGMLRYHLKRNYGLTLEQRDALIKHQDNKCAICLINFDEGIKMCVDHDHTTKAVRGLLCDNCNRGLGNFLDNTNTLQLAITYLTNRSTDEQ